MPQEMKSYCKNVLNFMGHYYTQEGEGSGEHQQAGLATTNSFFSVSFFVQKRGNTFLFRSSQQLPRLRLEHSKGFFS